MDCLLTHECYEKKRVNGKLYDRESLDLEQHGRDGHVPKRKDSAVCQQADGPIKKHKRVEDADKGMHTEHVGLSGPHVEAEDLRGHVVSYMLVAVLRIQSKDWEKRCFCHGQHLSQRKPQGM